jgi:hypothetical protein
MEPMAMKCVVSVLATALESGTIVRVSDEEAFQMVERGTFKYVPKHLFKKQEAEKCKT